MTLKRRHNMKDAFQFTAKYSKWFHNVQHHNIQAGKTKNTITYKSHVIQASCHNVCVQHDMVIAYRAIQVST